MSMQLRAPLASEAEVMHTVVAAVEEHDQVPERNTAEDVADWFDDPHLNPELDLRVAEIDGVIVGWARCTHRASGQRLERALLYGGVHPDHRGKGVGRALLEWSEARADEQLEPLGTDLPRYKFVEAYEGDSDRRSLHAAAGYEDVRWFVLMRRPLDEVATPSAPPPGIEIVPWAEEHTALVRHVNAEAFADHWASTPHDEASWAHGLATAGFRRDLSFIALDGDRIVAYSLNENFPQEDELTGMRTAWVGSLGTLRAYRKRGIASCLLEASHARFAEGGFTHAMLDVDADSPSGAGAIYERHGYEPITRIVVGQKEL